MFRSTTARVAALYTLLFALSVVILGGITFYATRAALSDQFDSRIKAESQALQQEYKIEGLEGVLQAVRERDQTPGALDYGLEGNLGQPMAGRLAGLKAGAGWSALRLPEQGGRPDTIRVLTVDLPEGRRLLVGDELERITVLDHLVLRGFGWAFFGVVIIGMAGGFALSRDVHRRLAAISGTAEAIIDGDLSRRVPVHGHTNDLDRLASTFNRMLDRISALMESLRQVSNDIAHDLRTPLTRLRNRLEVGLGPSAAAGQRATVDAALADLDAILDTFAALLRIAQIEGGARRAGFRPIDLVAVATTVIEALILTAEEGERVLKLTENAPVIIEGDPELLTQMVLNLVENALIHTAPGSTVRVHVSDQGGMACLEVSDDGPGIPLEERHKVVDRFYRLERSRSTPGSGLGLALAAAVARLHGTRLELEDNNPGLQVRVQFPGPK